MLRHADTANKLMFNMEFCNSLAPTIQEEPDDRATQALTFRKVFRMVRAIYMYLYAMTTGLLCSGMQQALSQTLVKHKT